MPALEKKSYIPQYHRGLLQRGGWAWPRIDGQVVFVHDAVRGEDCDILVMKVLKNVAFGKPVLRYSTSPHRQEPTVPTMAAAGASAIWTTPRSWGQAPAGFGCPDRLGGSDVTVEEILGAAQPLRYRNKSQYRCPPTAGWAFIGPAAIRWWRWSTASPEAAGGCTGGGPAAVSGAVSCAGIRRDPPAGGWCGTCMCRATVKAESLVCLLVNGESPLRRDGTGGPLAAVRRHHGPWAWCWGQYPPRQRHSGDRYRTLGGGRPDGRAVRSDGFRLSVPSFYQGEPPPGGGAVRQGAGVRRSHRYGAGGGSVLRRRHHHAGAGSGRPASHRRRRSCRRPSGMHGPAPGATAWRTWSFWGDAADVAAELAPAAAAAGCHLRGPAPEGTGPGGHRLHRRHGSPAGGVCLLRPPAHWAGMCALPRWATSPAVPWPWTSSPPLAMWRRYACCPNFKARNISRLK